MQNSKKIKKRMLYKSVFENLEYLINFKLEEDKIHIIIQENNEFVPYTYEGFFSLEDFISHHKVFMSCSTIEEILEHLSNLYDNRKIFIGDIAYDDHRYMYFKVMNIAKEENTQHFDLKRKMVENKDDAMIELYEEEKKLIGKIRKIKKLINKEEEMDDDLLKKQILDEISCDTVL